MLDRLVLDARTIWLFREKLTNAGAIKTPIERAVLKLMFGALIRAAERFNPKLGQAATSKSGQIADASLIAAPHQRRMKEGPGRSRIRWGLD